MRIVNNDHQTSVSMAEKKRTDGSKQNRGKNEGSVFAGDMNQQEDNITMRKKKLLKEALKVVMDQYKNDGKIDEGIKESRKSIEENKQIMQESNAVIQEIRQERDKLREAHGVAADSQEQQDLELIDKARYLKSEGRMHEMSEEELTRLAEMGPLTDYQKESLKYGELQDEYRKELNGAKEVILGESRSVEGTKQSLLGRKYHMGKASRVSAEMRKSAAKEIAGMMYQEAKDHIDEDFKELQEEAKKIAEKKKEQEEALEKVKDKKKEQEENIGSATENSTETDEMLQEMKKLVEEQKLLEEDKQGVIVDVTV